jgi:hypothetical protein
VEKERRKKTNKKKKGVTRNTKWFEENKKQTNQNDRVFLPRQNQEHTVYERGKKRENKGRI